MDSDQVGYQQEALEEVSETDNEVITKVIQRILMMVKMMWKPEDEAGSIGSLPSEMSSNNRHSRRQRRENSNQEVEDVGDNGAAAPSSSSRVKRRRSSSNENRNPRSAKNSRTSRPVGNTDQDDRNLEFDAPTVLEMPIQASLPNSRSIEDERNDLFNGPADRSLAKAVVNATGTLAKDTMNLTIKMFITNFRNLLQHYNNEETARKEAFRRNVLWIVQNLVLEVSDDVSNQNLNNDQEKRAPENVYDQNPKVPEEEDAPEEAPETRNVQEDEVNLGSVEADAEAKRSEAPGTNNFKYPSQESEEQGTSGFLENHQENFAQEDGDSKDNEIIDVGGPDDRWSSLDSGSKPFESPITLRMEFPK